MTSPKQLEPISDTVDTSEVIEGVISTDDEDAYQRKIVDNSGYLDPYASTSSPNVQLCMFLQCDDNDEITIKDCNGAVGVDYSATRKGCCGPVVDIDYECPGINGDDTVQAFVRITSTAPQCEAYTITLKQ